MMGQNYIVLINPHSDLFVQCTVFNVVDFLLGLQIFLNITFKALYSALAKENYAVIFLRYCPDFGGRQPDRLLLNKRSSGRRFSLSMGSILYKIQEIDNL